MKTRYMKNLLISFMTIVTVIIIGVFYNIKTIDIISQEVTGLYEHPYRVNSVVRDININLVSMHGYMKDVALATTPKELLLAIDKVQIHERNVLLLLPFLYDKYLGDKADITRFEKDFRAWKSIRQEVILLTEEKKYKQASSLTKDRGTKHLQIVISDLKHLTNFADKKGEEYIKNIIVEKENTTQLTLFLSAIALIIVIVIYLYILRDTQKKELKIQRYFDMIDANIFSLIFDNTGNIVEASSALALFLGTTKKELLQKHISYIVKNEEQRSLLMLSVEDGFKWEGELHFENDIYLYLRVAPTTEEDGRVLYSMIIDDISDKKRIELLSNIDPLTGLYNRRFFDTIAPKELKQMARKKEHAVFVMIDIDYFKLYNDHYGHPEGDATLQAVAYTLKKYLRRPHDYAFRLGGEEFGLLFSAEPLDELTLYLQGLIEAVENLHIHHAKSQVSEYVTISMGAVYVDATKTSDVDAIYLAADKLLYKAKHEGRNQLQIDVL